MGCVTLDGIVMDECDHQVIGSLRRKEGRFVEGMRWTGTNKKFVIGMMCVGDDERNVET